MPRIKGIIITAVVIVCGIAAVFMAYNKYMGQNAALSALIGVWNTESAGYNIFSGRTEIVSIESRREDAYKRFLVVYDSSRRSLFCAEMNTEHGQYFCQPVLLKKDKITSGDRANQLEAELIEDIPPFLVEFRLQENSLKIMGTPLTDENCVLHQKCNMLLLSKLQR